MLSFKTKRVLAKHGDNALVVIMTCLREHLKGEGASSIAIQCPEAPKNTRSVDAAIDAAFDVLIHLQLSEDYSILGYL